MPRNRILNRLSQTSQGALVSTCGFVACPMVLQQGVAAEQQAWQRQLYQRAMEEAAAVVRPSIVERWQSNLMN
jgi:hypothetical protein